MQADKQQPISPRGWLFYADHAKRALFRGPSTLTTQRAQISGCQGCCDIRAQLVAAHALGTLAGLDFDPHVFLCRSNRRRRQGAQIRDLGSPVINKKRS